MVEDREEKQEDGILPVLEGEGLQQLKRNTTQYAIKCLHGVDDNRPQEL
jgi:hypothetical protein